MTRKITPTHAAALLAFVAVTGISWMHTPSETGVESSAPMAATKIHSRDDARARRYGPPGAVQQRMEQIRQSKDPRERMRGTIDLVNSLPVAELGRWLERGWFAAGDGYEGRVFTLLATERWRQEDPEGYVAWGLRTKKGGKEVLAEWARTDPERMLGFFRKHPDPTLELQLWGTAPNLDAGFAMKRLLELVQENRLDRNFVFWPVDGIARAIAKSDPSLLERHVGDFPMSWRYKVMGAIVGTRLQADFPGEVAKLAEMPDGWNLMMAAGRTMEDFSLRILDSVADFPATWKASMVESVESLVNDPRWLDVDIEGLGFTPEQARAIRAQAMRMAVFSSPKRVLGELHEADLTDEQRQQVLGSLFHPGNDPEIMAKLLACLKSPELRQQAGAMMEPPVESANEAPGDGTVSAADGQQSWMVRAGEQSASAMSYELMQETAGWNDETAASMIADFKKLPEDKRRAVAHFLARGSTYTKDPNPAVTGEAVRFLVEDLAKVDESWRAQSEEQRSGEAALHAARWVTEDPSAASQWVLTLPAGKSREHAIHLLMTTWKRYDPDAAGQWTGRLPAQDRDALEGRK